MSVTPAHKPQRNSSERQLKLHMRRNRQNVRDSKRAYQWARFKRALLSVGDLPAALLRAAA